MFSDTDSCWRKRGRLRPDDSLGLHMQLGVVFFFFPRGFLLFKVWLSNVALFVQGPWYLESHHYHLERSHWDRLE